MGLEVDPPSPPALGVDEDDAYRRREIADHLENGAWETAFEAWAKTTEIDRDAYAIAVDLELFDRFDFFWDEFAQRVGFAAPGIPDDWDRVTYHDELTSWRQVSAINAGFVELGQTVCDVLKDEYLEWESDDWGDDLDLPSFD